MACPTLLEEHRFEYGGMLVTACLHRGQLTRAGTLVPVLTTLPVGHWQITIGRAVVLYAEWQPGQTDEQALRCIRAAVTAELGPVFERIATA